MERKLVEKQRRAKETWKKLGKSNLAKIEEMMVEELKALLLEEAEEVLPLNSGGDWGERGNRGGGGSGSGGRRQTPLELARRPLEHWYGPHAEHVATAAVELPAATLLWNCLSQMDVLSLISAAYALFRLFLTLLRCCGCFGGRRPKLKKSGLAAARPK